MAFRNIFIENDTYLSTKNEQLIIYKDVDYFIPLEDINCIMIDNLHSKVSSYCIDKFSEYAIVVYICDKKHVPHSVILPFETNCRHFKFLKYQINISKPVQKKLWQQIIKQKIKNQAICYKLLGSEDSYLEKLSNNVLSGDSTNIEATAAVYYFKAICGYSFKRRNPEFINSAFNYGYDMVNTHEKRLKLHLPENGSVRLLIITEKQYEAVRILVGNKSQNDELDIGEQISFF